VIIVTDQKTPAAEPDSILVQDRYAIIPQPQGQKPSGVYYSWKGKWVDMWDKFITRTQALIEANLAKYVPTSRTITINGDTKDLSADRSWTISGRSQNLEQVLTEGNDGGGLAIENIADPTNAQDAATKNYVDSAVSVTPAALTKTDDTNVTLTLGGTPGTALLQAVSLTLGWTGTLADSRIASAATWSAKQDAITGAATTITSSNLTASRAVISSASGKVAVSTVTDTELGYVSGVTSAIQTQLDNRPILISTATASTTATIDFTLSSSYKSFEIRCISVVPSTDNVGMWIRISTDGGSTFLSGASDYAYQRSILSGTTYTGTLTATDSKIAVVDAGAGTGTGRYCNTIITVFNPSISSMYKNIAAKQYIYRSDGAYNIREVNGVYLSNTAVNAIRILMSSGNIASGTFELWGYK